MIHVARREGRIADQMLAVAGCALAAVILSVVAYVIASQARSALEGPWRCVPRGETASGAVVLTCAPGGRVARP
jgi:hypothetical protein